jgi:hypothetical protein
MFDHDAGSVFSLVVSLIGADDGFDPRIKWGLTKSGRIFAHWQLINVLADWTYRTGADNSDENGLPFKTPLNHLDIQVQIRPEPRPFVYPITREWANRFLPGGLPSLRKMVIEVRGLCSSCRKNEIPQR